MFAKIFHYTRNSQHIVTLNTNRNIKYNNFQNIHLKKIVFFQVAIEMMPIESTKRESIGMFYINVISFAFGLIFFIQCAHLKLVSILMGHSCRIT